LANHYSAEPLSAFFKLRIDRPKLVRWLDSPVRRASQWTDWRDIGGQYHNVGVQELRDFSDADMARTVAESDALLLRYKDNRAAVREIMNSAEEPYLKHASYRTDTQDFVAGSLTYAENLVDYIAFYTVVRGAAASFAGDDYGIAVIHNYQWGSTRDTSSAMRLGPGPL